MVCAVFRTADETVQRQQKEKRPERFRALRDAHDGFGLQRMQRPQQCDQEGEPWRGRAETLAHDGPG